MKEGAYRDIIWEKRFGAHIFELLIKFIDFKVHFIETFSENGFPSWAYLNYNFLWKDICSKKSIYMRNVTPKKYFILVLFWLIRY